MTPLELTGNSCEPGVGLERQTEAEFSGQCRSCRSRSRNTKRNRNSEMTGVPGQQQVKSRKTMKNLNWGIQKNHYSADQIQLSNGIDVRIQEFSEKTSYLRRTVSSPLISLEFQNLVHVITQKINDLLKLPVRDCATPVNSTLSKALLDGALGGMVSEGVLIKNGNLRMKSLPCLFGSVISMEYDQRGFRF